MSFAVYYTLFVNVHRPYFMHLWSKLLVRSSWNTCSPLHYQTIHIFNFLPSPVCIWLQCFGFFYFLFLPS